MSSSNQQQKEGNQTPAAASAAIPLLVPQKKKQSGNPKMRVRPTRVLKKNTLKRKGPVLPRTASNSGTPSTTSKSAAATVESEGISGPSMDVTASFQAGPVVATATRINIAATASSPQTQFQALNKNPPRRAARKINSGRPTRTSSTGKRGLSINVGSSMKKVRSTSIRAGSLNTRNTIQNDEGNKQISADVVEEVQHQEQPISSIISDSNAITMSENEINTNVPTDRSNATPMSTAIEEVEIIPYQHLGQLDPSLNIAAPKPNEKTMKDFCSRYKIPRAAKLNDEKNVNNINEGNNNINETVGGGVATTRSATDEEPLEEKKDNRSGPLVEIINGEIVIKESTMIVGGRRTTEEVDRELEGGIVVEENTGITATYTSFTKREKVQRWNVEETRKFYLALRQCGTDFSTMESFFDGADGGNKRSRKQLKSRYKRECKKNLHLIDMAMNPKVQLPLDLSVFGDLDMDAVKDSVVPLGQASVGGASGNAGMKGGAVAILAQSMTPDNIDDAMDDEPEVVVEIMGEENVRDEPAVVTQEISQLSKGSEVSGAGEVQEASKASSLSAPKATTKEVSTIPLLVPAATKKKPRPKFRMKPKGPAKGKAKLKRLAK
jgi:transcription factor TFIIIB component B''